VVFCAVPKQSLRAWSRYDVVPGPPGAAPDTPGGAAAAWSSVRFQV